MKTREDLEKLRNGKNKHLKNFTEGIKQKDTCHIMCLGVCRVIFGDRQGTRLESERDRT